MADESTAAAVEATASDANRLWLLKQSMLLVFRDNLGLALRGEVMCLVIGVAFMLSLDYHILPEVWTDPQRQSLINSFAVVMLIFTLHKNVGETICFARQGCLLYTSPSPRDKRQSRMPSSA